MADIPTRIGRVELRCSDVEASAEAYGRLLGLEPARLDADRGELRAPGGAHPLLVLLRAERAGRAPSRATGLFHTAFRYRERAGLASALRRIGERVPGMELTGASDHGVSEALYLDDPDGLGIEIYRDRPAADWPEPGGGERVRMFTAPLDLGDLLAADTGLSAEQAAAGGIDIGHVHLKVADPDTAVAFWTERVGFDLMTRFGAQAVFLGMDGYHHHVGANSWLSRGAAPEPAHGPGLEAVAVRAGAGEGRLETPDGVSVLLEGDGS